MFQKPDATKCLLCGSREKLTGEHKIKASALKEQFGNETLTVGSSDGVPGVKNRIAQSVRSKHLKFSAKLCEECNTSRTQLPDIAFDELRESLSARLSEAGGLTEADAKAMLPIDPEKRAHVFRYFAKLLACHIAEIGGPVQTEITKFAIGWSDVNPINITVGLDETYKLWNEASGEHSYAAHGGLMIFGSKWLNLPQAFYSSVSIGPVQYGFDARLNLFGQIQLAQDYPEFFEWCRKAIMQAKKNPLSDWEKKRAGF